MKKEKNTNDCTEQVVPSESSCSVLFGWKISIDDGFVEYTYDFNIEGTHSIHTVLGIICASLGVNTPPKGKIRESHEFRPTQKKG